MNELKEQDLIELRNAILIALDLTNDQISSIPAQEAFDDTFVFLIEKAKYYIDLLARINDQLKQM
jgi:anion-transporting  ArsA/GET3 family ATPase